MEYIVRGPRRHGKWDYFMGFHDSTPVITLEEKNAKKLSEKEANEIIVFLSGPYKKYEKLKK